MEAVIDPAQDLLRRAVDGDAAALEQVARAWYVRIRRWALIDLGDPALAEDAVQEALIRLVRNIAKYDPDRPFAPWLRTIVKNCARRTGEQQRRHDHTDLAEHHLTVVPRAEHAIDTHRRGRRAVELFDQLSARQREVLHLCTHEGLSAAEAARELGIAPATARVLLFRARRTLRSALSKEMA